MIHKYSQILSLFFLFYKNRIVLPFYYFKLLKNKGFDTGIKNKMMINYFSSYTHKLIII